jgi:hypothetical protein
MARLRLIRRLLLRFGQIGWRRRALVAEAVLCLFAARLALIFVPFPRLARRLGRFVTPEEARRLETLSTTEETQAATDIGWAVTRAARYVPFKAVCLPQAMAAHTMLRRRGVASIMHFGAAKGAERTVETHAWLDAAGVEVTGYPVAKGFAEVACFV